MVDVGGGSEYGVGPVVVIHEVFQEGLILVIFPHITDSSHSL